MSILKQLTDSNVNYEVMPYLKENDYLDDDDDINTCGVRLRFFREVWAVHLAVGHAAGGNPSDLTRKWRKSQRLIFHQSAMPHWFTGHL